MPPGLGRCPAQETSIARSGEGGKGFEKPGPEGGKGFEKLQPRGGKGFEKVVRKRSLGFENRQLREKRCARNCATRDRSTSLLDIVMEESGIDVQFTGTVTLNNDCQCRLAVGNDELDEWQVLKRALEKLFFAL
jgi:hypothetical protein